MSSSERSTSHNKCYPSQKRARRTSSSYTSSFSSSLSSSTVASTKSPYLYLLCILKILSSPSTVDAFTIMSTGQSSTTLNAAGGVRSSSRFTPSSASTLLRNHNHFLNSLSSSSSSSAAKGVGASLPSSKGVSTPVSSSLSSAFVEDMEELLQEENTMKSSSTVASVGVSVSATTATNKRRRKSRAKGASGANTNSTPKKRRRILKLKPKKKKGSTIDIVQVMPIQIQKTVGVHASASTSTSGNVNISEKRKPQSPKKKRRTTTINKRNTAAYHQAKSDHKLINTNLQYETNNTPENQNERNNEPQKIKMKKSRRKSSSSSQSTIRVNNLLTREEEISLTSSIKSLRSVIRNRDELSVSKTMNNPGSSVDSYLPNPMYKVDAHTNYKMPLYKIQPTEQEWARACNNISIVQLRRILVKGREARKRLVDSNVGLVTQVAKKYSTALQKTYRDNGGFDNIGTILTLSDLIQEGNLGLMEAAERFEGERGFRFATYAVHWVRSRILRCIADNSRVIRLPAHVHTTLRTIRKTKSEMEQEIGRDPSMPELAHRLQMPISKLKLYTDSSLPVLSLEVPLSNGKSSKSGAGGDVDKRTLMDRIASDSPTPEEDAEFESLRIDIRTAIDSLGNDEERDVLLNRFGLEDGNPRTLGETAHRMGISREKVRRIEARALNKLRHPQRNYMLKEYVENACNDSRFSSGDGLVEKREEMMNNNHPQGGNNKDRMTHFGDDTLNRFTPEMIWSF